MCRKTQKRGRWNRAIAALTTVYVARTQVLGDGRERRCSNVSSSIRLRSITCNRKAPSRRDSESRPCAAGCGNARHNRRRSATANAIALEVAPWPAVTQKQQAAIQALQGKRSKRQCKRHRANTATGNSKASATRQTAPQPQPAPLSHRRNSYRGALSTSKCACPGGMNGEVGPRSGHAPSPPLRPVYTPDRVYVASVVPCV